jgi:hypothetical protein
MNEEAE